VKVTDVTSIKLNPTIDSNLFVAPGKLPP